MIKKIIHLADLHIPNEWDKSRPYDLMLKKGLSEVYKTISKLKEEGVTEDEYRIVVCGDIFHNKVRVSTEANKLCYEIFDLLNAMGKTIIIAGNHDMLQSNKDKLDAVTPIFSLRSVLPNITYLDKACSYKSNCVIDDNVVWCLYSMFDDFKSPSNLEELKKVHPDKIFIGLYHGDIVGASTETGKVTEDGIPFNTFGHCNAVMLGHIHKYQEIRKNGIPFVYAGSLIQQNFGENTTQHGFVEWDLTPKLSHKLVEVNHDYKLFKFKITSYEDVENNLEKLLNL